MHIVFSSESSAIISCARDEAMRTGHLGINADHILLGILRHADNDVCRALKGTGIDTSELKEFIDSAIFSQKAVPYDDLDKIRFTKATRNLIGVATLEALREKSQEITTAHLFLAVMRCEDSAGKTYLTESGLGYDDFRGIFSDMEEKQKEETIRRNKPVDISGALGEQLQILLDSANQQSNFLS